MAKTTCTGQIVEGSNGTDGEVRIKDGKNVNEQKYITLKAPATITADTTLTFPDGAGSAGQILSTDGNGTLSWVNDSAGNPAGTTGQVQVNDGGVFGAISEGTAGQVLKSNGAGVAPSFQTDATNSPGGSNTNMQFNDNGSFGGISNGTAGQVLTSNGAGSTPTFQAAPAGGIAAVVDDPTPQLGGNLDLNGQTINGAGNLDISNGTIQLDGNHPDGTNNVALGNDAGLQLSSGAEDNTLIGKDAGRACQNNDRSTAVGADALKNCISGQNNTAIGKSALQNATSNDNTAIGREAGSNLINGSNCTFIGQFAQPSSASATNEITLGNPSVTSLRIPGLQGSASSGDVLTFNGTAITLATPSGGAATDVDVNGGRVNLRGNLSSLIVPTNNASQAMGGNVLNNTSGCFSSTAIGEGALRGTSSGQESNDNVAIGQNAMGNYTGSFAGPPNQQGHGNTCVGNGSGDEISGNNNVCLGLSAGNRISGFNNTAVGQGSMNGFPALSGENNTCIGSNAVTSSQSVNNEITLGDAAIATLRCNVTSITSLSDARDKKDVEDANIGLDFINDLRPVKFVWDTRDGKKKDIKEVGFIAQELDEVQQKHGVEDHLQLVLKNNPDKLEASPGKLIPILVQAIKDLKKEIDELKKA